MTKVSGSIPHALDQIASNSNVYPNAESAGDCARSSTISRRDCGRACRRPQRPSRAARQGPSQSEPRPNGGSPAALIVRQAPGFWKRTAHFSTLITTRRVRNTTSIELNRHHARAQYRNQRWNCRPASTPREARTHRTRQPRSRRQGFPRPSMNSAPRSA